MSLASADFCGITEITSELADQLEVFLTDREEDFLKAAYTAFQLEPIAEDKHELLLERVHRLLRSTSTPLDFSAFEHTQEVLNQALWRYLRVLEDGVSQLFQQLDRKGTTEWTYALSQVVDRLESLFRERMETLTDVVISLEESLWTSFKHPRSHIFGWLPKSIQRLGSFLLDRQLLPNLRNSRRFLQTRYGGWQARYVELVKLGAQADQSVAKLEGYHNLQELEAESREQFTLIYRALKIWEVDAKERAILLQDLMKAIKSQVSSEQALLMFQAYYTSIHRALFQGSRRLKELANASGDTFDADKGVIHAEMKGAQTELATLGRALARYRQFLLRTDSNPYVRSRWGFAEWVVGPEPDVCKKLLRTELAVEGLAVQYNAFMTALVSATKQAPDSNLPICNEVEDILHAMSQPLNSRRTTAGHIDRLIDVLQRFDELTATHPDSVAFYSKTLDRALKADRKYHAIHDHPEFAKLYNVHRDLVHDLLNDQEHQQLIVTLRAHIAKTLRWLRKGHLEKHMVDVDLFVEQMEKACVDLQERFETERSVAQNPIDQTALVAAYQERVLELRCLLGSFYRYLLQSPTEGQQVRSQFLSVDQALDVVAVVIAS